MAQRKTNGQSAWSVNSESQQAQWIASSCGCLFSCAMRVGYSCSHMKAITTIVRPKNRMTSEK
ncbi:hypothetical protein D3C83_167780 [compost metagenome]